MIHKKYLLLFLIFPSIIFSQLEPNKHVAGAALGFSFLGSAFQIGLDHEYIISSNDLGIGKNGLIGIGGIFRYWSYSENFAHVDWEYDDILLGVQSNYHFYMSDDKIDPWFGIIVAYDFGNSDYEINTIGHSVKEDDYGGLWLGANAGIRYWFANNMAAGVRIGFGTMSYGALDFCFDYKF